ncbi:MAG TPA: hypothetical protein PKL64_04585 [Bacteroidales bacterium]|nr:hypothetical protein [Bacteroidales bacterium]
MRQLNIITLFLILFANAQVQGQTMYSICDIYTVNSQNDKYFLQTVPFDNIEQTSTGKTMVFNSDSLKIYEIARNFEIDDNRKELFLSNDGKTIAYVIDREFNWDGVQNKSIEIFKNGYTIKQFQLTDLIDCNSDNEDCYLFYKEAIDTITWESGERKIIYKEKATDFEKQLTDKATFLYNDTLYIFAKTGKLLIIDLNSTELTVMPLSGVNEIWFKQIKPIRTKSEKFKPSSLYGLPKLKDGISLEEGLAENLNMTVFPKDKKGSDKYKRYSINIQVIIDTNGNAILDKIENYNGLPEEKIKTFIEEHKFETNSIPKETEKWRFSSWIALMNKNKKEAKKEKQKEIIEEREVYNKRIIADSINGLYIPKNLEECFLELNKLLKPKDIETIKNLKSKDDMNLYHFGLGTWLRNNWGLWGGSRLQQYFFKKGIDHPDNMSGIILSYYYDWLNGQHDEWKKFEAK